MLLTITASEDQAGDLSYLLHKRPNRFQSFELSFGKAHVFYSHVLDVQVTACLLLDVDPVGMAKKSHGQSGQLDGYVNDRPYVTSSFMSTAIAAVFGSAMAGRCTDRPEAVDKAMNLAVRIESLPVRGGEVFLRSLFEPLGYQVNATGHVLDACFPEWEQSPYFTVELQSNCILSDLLTHLYVLIPVFDNQKHYFVGHDEIEKLLSKGQGWLATHPCKEAITRRYLRHQGGMVRQALESLRIKEDGLQAVGADEGSDAVEIEVEVKVGPEISLNQMRHQTVIEEMIACGASRVVDLGCGEGKLLRGLLAKKQFTEILGMDVSVRALEIAAQRLRLESLPQVQADRIKLIHGSLLYRDQRLAAFDAACLVEVIEHLDPPRLTAMQRVVFEHARPRTVIVTTPNVEYNAVWESLPAGKLRHSDHRFEWTRSEFEAWSTKVAAAHGYSVRLAGIGPESEGVGTPTQMAVFFACDALRSEPES